MAQEVQKRLHYLTSSTNMDNTHAQVLQNFKGLFGRYKAVIAQDDRYTRITVDNQTIQIQNPRTIQTQILATRL